MGGVFCGCPEFDCFGFDNPKSGWVVIHNSRGESGRSNAPHAHPSHKFQEFSKSSRSSKGRHKPKYIQDTCNSSSNFF
eukprot:COSAG05_NODE_372_length_10695_cov_5.301623_8_plen_78_part_00